MDKAHAAQDYLRLAQAAIGLVSAVVMAAFGVLMITNGLHIGSE